MLFKKDDARIEKLMDQALSSAEFQRLNDHAGITVELLRRELRRRIPKIWDVVATDVDELDRLLEQLKAAEKVRDEEGPRSPGFGGLNAIIACTVLAIVIGAPATGYFLGWAKLLFWVKMPVGLYSVGGAVVLLLSAILVRIFRGRRYNEAESEHLRAVEDRLGPTRLKMEIDARNAALDGSLLGRGINAELREIVKDNTEPSYSFVISSRIAPGLAEVFDSAYEVTTAAKSRLLELVESMPGGSIGIAGPRGVGKSTLIASVCGGSVTTIRERPLFTMVTSAPVKYEARDFILHIFSSLCEAVLRIDASEYSSRPSVKQPSAQAGNIRRWSGWIAGFGSLLGIFLLAFAFLIAALQTANPPTAPVAGKVTPTTISNVLFGAPGFAPGTFLVGGVYCIVIALAATIAGSTAPGFVPLMRLSPIPRHDDDDDTEARMKYHSLKRAAEERLGRDITRMAIETLDEIRFQRGYTSGWTGALKFPIGLEGNINSALSWSEKQRSVPELVAMFRRFVKFLTTKHAIIVGIDELDKLESHESAQQFLNEIKAIFNLDHCYYVVSVSENAINNFERRGLPFRDAFDSAFDTILYVDYLKLADAKRLIQRRVIGLEVPFLDLCYCLSGGLPRDLIRVCRDMLAQAAIAPASDLGSICAATVLADVRSKLRVMGEAIALIHVENESARTLAKFRKVEQAANARQTFLSARRDISRPTGATIPENNEACRRLARIVWEAYAYLYFCATVLEFFGGALTELLLRAAEQNGSLERLCRVRQQFSLDTQIAVSELDQIRADWNFEVDCVEEAAKGSRLDYCD